MHENILLPNAARRIRLRELLPRVLITPNLDPLDLARFGALQDIALAASDACAYEQDELGRFLSRPVASVEVLRCFSDAVLSAWAALPPAPVQIAPGACRVIDLGKSEQEIASLPPADLCNAAW